jgi:Txe/YoeB family toxin of Txe-Axe toxin-antitoxin module
MYLTYFRSDFHKLICKITRLIVTLQRQNYKNISMYEKR